MSTKKRILSFLLAFIMLVSLSPAVYAEDETEQEENPIQTEELDEGQQEESKEPDAETADDSLPKIEAETPVEEDKPAEEAATNDNEESIAEEQEEDVAEPGEEISSAALVTFKSSRVLSLHVYSANGEIHPASEDTPYDTATEQAFSASYLLQPGNYTYSAYAETCIGVKNVAFNVEEESTEQTIEVTLTELPYGFKGMPEGYELSDEQLEAKSNLRSHNVVETLVNLVPGENYVDGELIFLADTEEYANQVAYAYSAELERFSYGVAVIKPQTATVLEAVAAAADQDIPLPCVEPNYIQRLEPVYESEEDLTLEASLSGDVPKLQSWETWYESTDNPDEYLKDPTACDYQYYHDIVNTYEAWGITKGAGVKVAVLDTGVAAHADIGDVTTKDIGATGDYEHGTHVAGIIAADVGNGVGGAGIAPDASIISIQIFSAGGAENEDVVAGINAAVKNGANIINMSIGGHVYSTIVESALADAVGKGVTPVISMGNDGTNIKTYPAAYDIPGLIAVGSSTEAGTRSVFSNYGAWEDVLAPGTDIMSSVPTEYNASGYEMMSGTSMAAPVVSGVCALYKSVYPDATPLEVERKIKSATTNGVIDASKLFTTAEEKVAPEISVTANQTVEYGSKVTISANTVTASGITGEIVFTIDGKNPTVSNGIPQGNTKIYEGPIEVTSANGFTPGKKITIKAACVNGLGMLSSINSKAFTVGYATADSVKINNAPKSIIQGKTAALEFTVSPAEAQQSVTWTIAGNTGCPGTVIDSKGTLKVASMDAGTVTVRAEASNGKFAEATIKVESGLPANTVTLNYAKYTLKYSSNGAETLSLIPTAKDKNKAVVFPNFQWKTSNPKVASVDVNGMVTAVGKGSATISCTALDGSKKTAKCTVTVLQLAESITITGQERIAPGKTGAFKANVYPTNANNKKVTWSLESKPDGVEIDKNGKVKVPQNVTSGTIVILATAADGSGTVSRKTIDIAPLATSIVLKVKDCVSIGGGGYVYNTKTGHVKSATLWTVQTDYYAGSENLLYDSSLPLSAEVKGAENVPLLWTSSNTKVATVDDSGLIEAVAPGSAKITCKAQDGSNKSSSVSIKVIIPASGVTVVSSSKTTWGDNFKIIAPGKSVSNKAVVSSAFGKPTSTKVSWDLGVRVYSGYNEDDGYIGECTTLENEIYKYYTKLSSSGKLSASKYISDYAARYYVFLDVYAITSGDGTYLSNYVTYIVSAEAIQDLAILDYGIYYYDDDADEEKLLESGTFNKSKYVKSGTVTCKSTWGNNVYVEIPLYYLSSYGVNPEIDYTVKSSNPNIAGALINSGYIYIYPNSEGRLGSSKITVTTTDGSNKSVTVTVKVVK